MEQNGASLEQLEQLTLGALRKAVVDGDVVQGSVMAGQIAGLIHGCDTCEEIISEIITGARKLLGQEFCLSENAIGNTCSDRFANA